MFNSSIFSGPSLEIISDTEEWLTDDDVVIKEEDSVTVKPKSKKNADKVKGKARHISKDKAKPNPKAPINPGKDSKSADVNVKVEGQKPEPKEGETLLDLLELEMRARAIRALIRKEEDIIPEKPTAGTSSEKNGATTPAVVNPAVSKYVVQEMQQISVALRQGSGLDDDVMLVIQPAPTIELLSSDSENENKEEKEKETDKQEQSKRVNQRLEKEREDKEEDNKEAVENKESDEDNHEQSKRVNKRLENERGAETSHSTSTIGDEVVEIPDEELKKEDESPAASERNETEPVIEERARKSPEDVDKETDKLEKSQDENPINTTAETNKTPEKISDEAKGKTEKSPEKMPDKDTNKKENEQEKIPDEPEKGSNEPENVVNEEKFSDKPKSPEKELEEGELTSDSEEEAPVINVNIEKLKFNKRVKRRRHIRSKVHESSEQSEDSDQNETSGSQSEVSDKDASKVKSKSRKKIRNRTRDLKVTSEEKVNESTKNTPDSIDIKVEEKLNEVEGQKELRNENAEKDTEEIIDLDDYSDDMGDLENDDKSKSGNSKKSDVKTAPETTAEQSEPSETWASRYYNTDDVQNVIKESKIHSEIRKRLRERQRIYKLNSPNPTAGSGSSNDIKVEEEKQKPLGSVEEYLALKAASAAAEAAFNEKTEVVSERSRKSGRRKDTSHKSKSHSSKRRSKSDKKSAKDGSTRKRKERDTTENSEARPD